MASESCKISEAQLMCFICKKVFTDPVTIPCGHSFCNICINKHWDQSKPYHCPECKDKFRSRPKLQTSIVVSGVVSEFKKKRQRESAGPETSESNPKVKKFQETCPEHGKPFMELFCRDHSQLMCVQCFSAHKTHNIVTLMDQCKDQQSELQQKVQEREEKIQQLQRSVELSQENADGEMKEGVEFFNDLMKSVQQTLDRFKKSINKKHQDIKKKAETLIKIIKSEISALEQRRAQMEEIWKSDDHFHFVQTFTSVKPAPEMNDWTEVSVRAPSYEGRVAIAVSELLIRKLNPKIKKLFEDELKQAKKHEVNVTLDPDTAHPYLDVSQNYKQVQFINRQTSLPDTPERFSTFLYVVGKQKFSSGKFYYEVQVKGKTIWWLGVTTESADRKVGSGDKITPENGYWEMKWGSNHPYLWSAPEKVGVFVDYEEGLMCLFDAETSALLSSFTDCCFTGNILPLFSPGNDDKGNNSAPLILTPVDV